VRPVPQPASNGDEARYGPQVLADANPFRDHPTQSGVVTFGAPAILFFNPDFMIPEPLMPSTTGCLCGPTRVSR
jgi:hypothetical protein